MNYALTLLTGVFVFGGLSLLMGAIFCFRARRRLTYG